MMVAETFTTFQHEYDDMTNDMSIASGGVLVHNSKKRDNGMALHGRHKVDLGGVSGLNGVYVEEC